MSEQPTLDITEYFAARRRLILADDPAEITRLETSIGETQPEVIDDFIENSCWSADLPDFVGGRGTPAERRAALRAVYLAQNPNG